MVTDRMVTDRMVSWSLISRSHGNHTTIVSWYHGMHMLYIYTMLCYVLHMHMLYAICYALLHIHYTISMPYTTTDQCYLWFTLLL